MIWYLRDLNDVIVAAFIGGGIALIIRVARLEITIRRRKP